MFTFTQKLVAAAAAVTALLATEAASASLTQEPALSPLPAALAGFAGLNELIEKMNEDAKSHGGFQGLTDRFKTRLAQAEHSDDDSSDEEEPHLSCPSAKFTMYPYTTVEYNAILPQEANGFGALAFPVSILFEPGATPDTFVLRDYQSYYAYPDLDQTWRLMYEYQLPRYIEKWNRLPITDPRKQAMAQLYVSLLPLISDKFAPWPYPKADDVVQALRTLIVNYWDPADLRPLAEIEADQAYALIVIKDQLAVLTFWGSVLEIGSFGTLYESNKVGCPLTWELTGTPDGLVYFNGAENALVIGEPATFPAVYQVCGNKQECYTFNIVG